MHDVNDLRLFIVILSACLAVQTIGIFLILGLLARLRAVLNSMTVMRRADGFGASDAQPWE